MAVMIGFDDQSPVESIFDDESQDKEVKDVNVDKLKAVTFTERRTKQFLENYNCSVVNDFGDDYHFTDEERQKKNKYYEIFKKFSKCKHKYRRIDQYVIAMREMMSVLEYVAENNGIYEPEKFMLMYLKGEIDICGLFIPKLMGKSKKYISFDYLTEFILSDEDPSKLVKKNVAEVYVSDDYEDFIDTLFTEEELERLTTPRTEEEIIENSIVVDESDPMSIKRDIITSLSAKEYKNIIKSNTTIVRALKQAKEEARSLGNMARYAYELTSDDLDQIERYDRKHNIVTSGTIPVLKGDIFDKDAYDRYMMELSEWEEENTFDNYHGKLKSLSEIHELELKQALESHGWNLRNLYGNKEKEKLLKKKLKEDNAREKELKRQLIEIDNRRKRRMGVDVDDEKKSKTKKKLKKTKKKLKKESNDILLNISGYDSFDEYSDEVLDWKM